MHARVRGAGSDIPQTPSLVERERERERDRAVRLPHPVGFHTETKTGSARLRAGEGSAPCLVCVEEERVLPSPIALSKERVAILAQVLHLHLEGLYRPPRIGGEAGG